MDERPDDLYDAVVIGGGAAGLSAAIALGRSRRRVALIDAGEPRNGVADGVHNFLTRDGVAPKELQRLGRVEAEGYGIRVIDGRATEARPLAGDGIRFLVSLDDGERLTARRLVLALGARDILPDIPGLRERFGRDVLHCPYCHGWEVRDRAIGIVGTGPAAVHQALMWRQLSDRVTLFLNEMTEPTDAEREQLDAVGIVVIPGAISALDVADDRLRAVALADGSRHPIEALATATEPDVSSPLWAGLGLEPQPQPRGPGTMIVVDETGQSPTRGVWVAGNSADPMAQVVVSAGKGLMAGAVVNFDLITEDTEVAVERARAQTTANAGT